MKTYKVELTENELSKLIIFLIQYLPKIEECQKAYMELALEYADINTKTYNTLKNNSIYYKEMFDILSNMEEKLNKIPF